MSRVVRAALTQTLNAYRDMPERIADLGELEGRLDDVRAANLEHHAVLARSAHEQGAQVICFGELFPAPYFALSRHEMWLALAEPLDGPTGRFVRTLARDLSMVIVAPLYELDPATGQRFNTALVVDADGEVCGFYSKSHVPNGRNEEGVFGEGFYFGGSTGRPQSGPRVSAENPFFPVFHTAVGKLGVAICYDRHFEGVMSSLALAGAEIVFSPAVTFGAKSARMWPLEFAVDAARWRIYIGGSNRSGQEAPWNQMFYGKSHFTGPEGRVLSLSDHPELVIADLDLDDLAGPDPAGWTLRTDWRPDTYTRGTKAGGAR